MTALKPRTASIVLYQGDDMTRLSDLRRAAEAARKFAALAQAEADDAKEADARAGDDESEELIAAKAEVQARKDEYDAAVDAAAERAVTVELHSIGRKRFRDLMAEHPPRKVKVKTDPPPDAEEGAEPTEVERTHEDDVGFDVNVETFAQALLAYIDPDEPEVRTIAQPEFPTVKSVMAFVENDIADGDFDGMWMAAYWLNRAPSADPKASRYSLEPRSS